MKRFKQIVVTALSGIMVVGSLIGGSISAKADVVWEPTNKFYTKHRSDCYSHERSYIANSPEGELSAYESPTSSKVGMTYENGEEVYIEYVYTDKYDLTWGMTGYEYWVPMDYLAERYDNTLFWEEHEDEIVSSEGDIFDGVDENTQGMYMYEYPGASEAIHTMNVPEVSVVYHTEYTDSYGHTWGYLGYYYATSGWVCVDDMDATFEELYPDGQDFSGVAPEAKEIDYKVVPGKGKVSLDGTKTEDSDKNETVSTESDDSKKTLIIVIIVIAAIVLATSAILIITLTSSKKKKK